MKGISKKAKLGLENAVLVVEQSIKAGVSPKLALKRAGIQNMFDTYYFMEYLIETNNYKLWKLLKN